MKGSLENIGKYENILVIFMTIKLRTGFLVSYLLLIFTFSFFTFFFEWLESLIEYTEATNR